MNFFNETQKIYVDTVLCDISGDCYCKIIELISSYADKFLFTTYKLDDCIKTLNINAKPCDTLSGSNIPFYSTDITTDIIAMLKNRERFIFDEASLIEDYCFIDKQGNVLLSVINHEGDILINTKVYETVLSILQSVCNEKDYLSYVNILKKHNTERVKSIYISVENMLSFVGEAFNFKTNKRTIFNIGNDNIYSIIQKCGLVNVFVKEFIWSISKSNDVKQNYCLCNEEYQKLRYVLETQFYWVIKDMIKTLDK